MSVYPYGESETLPLQAKLYGFLVLARQMSPAKLSSGLRTPQAPRCKTCV